MTDDTRIFWKFGAPPHHGSGRTQGANERRASRSHFALSAQSCQFQAAGLEPRAGLGTRLACEYERPAAQLYLWGEATPPPPDRLVRPARHLLCADCDSCPCLYAHRGCLKGARRYSPGCHSVRRHGHGGHARTAGVVPRALQGGNAIGRPPFARIGRRCSRSRPSHPADGFGCGIQYATARLPHCPRYLPACIRLEQSPEDLISRVVAARRRLALGGWLPLLSG